MAFPKGGHHSATTKQQIAESVSLAQSAGFRIASRLLENPTVRDMAAVKAICRRELRRKTAPADGRTERARLLRALEVAELGETGEAGEASGPAGRDEVPPARPAHAPRVGRWARRGTTWRRRSH